MPVNASIRNLGGDGRFSPEDARALEALVQHGDVSADEARDAVTRYGDVMDPGASSLLAAFTGAEHPSTFTGIPASLRRRGVAPPAAGDDVRTLQRALMMLGMRTQDAALTLPSGVDGKYGNETTNAVSAFQQARGIPATGAADPATLDALDQAVRNAGAFPRGTATPPATTSDATGTVGTRPRRGLAGRDTRSEAQRWRDAATAGARSIVDKSASHEKGIEDGGLGDFYGDHGTLAEAVHKGDKDTVAAAVSSMSNGRWTFKSMTNNSVTVQDASGAEKKLRESSCIGWVMDNVKAAYQAAGKADRFKEIESHMRASGMRGTVLCEELQKDGWKAVFYSPRTADDLASSSSSKAKLEALQMAEAGKRIWKAGGDPLSHGVKPDVVVTGYRDSEPNEATDALLHKLESAPFLVGVANGGTHTFVGHAGSVTDFHWTAGPDSQHAISETPIRTWEWDTGLYMIPPGAWPSATPGNNA